jgi:RNA polymerase sigma factor (TIGR02999 family)
MAPQTDSAGRTRLDAYYTAAYEELRRLASAVGRQGGRATLNPTTLVHEAWLKLARSPEFSSESDLHFKRIAARAMRQVLVEAARRRHARKRAGDGETAQLAFDDAVFGVTASGRLVKLDDALTELARVSERQAQVVEARFFGGLSVPEVADALGVSEVTVMRDWRAARAWLSTALAGP